MRTTVAVVTGLALAAGGCSLSSPEGAGTYSSLNREPVVAVVETPGNAQASGLPEGFEMAPDPVRMPGDPTRVMSDMGAGRVDPALALARSERAREHWEILSPRKATFHIPAVARAFGANTAGASAVASTGALAPAPEARNYDRAAAMQTLINGGKSAGQRICNGC